MKTKKQIKRLLVFVASFGISVLIIGGYSIKHDTPAYSQLYFNIGVSTPNLAFSLGNGVGAYYAPAFGAYIYGYNGYYWRWLNGGWVYASAYAGPWYPVTAGVYLPPILAFGPPPPIANYSPYFIWWRNNIGPWYRVNHPGWWGRHHAYLRNYNVWHEHEDKFYNNHPYQNWKMRRPFEHRGPVYHGHGGHEGHGFRGHGR